MAVRPVLRDQIPEERIEKVMQREGAESVRGTLVLIRAIRTKKSKSKLGGAEGQRDR